MHAGMYTHTVMHRYPPVVDTALGPVNNHSTAFTCVRVTLSGPTVDVIAAAPAAPVADASTVTDMLLASKSASSAVCVRVQVVLLPALTVAEPQESTVPELPLKLKLDSGTLPLFVTVTDAEQVKLPSVISTGTRIARRWRAIGNVARTWTCRLDAAESAD
jgi:hypothetical protein